MKMGTRNLIEVVLDGKVKVAQYGQWDGYLSGQGDGIAKFIHGDMDLDRFKASVSNCTFHDDDSLSDLKDIIDANEIDWIKEMPWLSRDCGSDVLAIIQDHKGLVLRDESDFKNDTLFCEFHYIVDLDSETVTCGGLTLPFADWTSEILSQIEDSDNENN